MDTVNFSALAPRYGLRPFYSFEGLGTSALNGGAINWGNLWSGFKRVGASLKHAGDRLWHSKTAQSIKRELEKSGTREKLAQSVALGVHGALDLANQALANKLERHLGYPVSYPEDAVSEEIDEAISPPKNVVIAPTRPREEELVLKKDGEPFQETLVNYVEEPPPYEEAVKTLAPAPSSSSSSVTLATEPIQRVGNASWLNALSAMTGVGIPAVKRRRCY